MYPLMSARTSGPLAAVGAPELVLASKVTIGRYYESSMPRRPQCTSSVMHASQGRSGNNVPGTVRALCTYDMPQRSGPIAVKWISPPWSLIKPGLREAADAARSASGRRSRDALDQFQKCR